MLRSLGRALASHDLALLLIGMMALVVVVGGTLPQVGRLASEDLLSFRNEWPLLAAWMNYLSLSAIFSSDWFLLLCLLLFINITAGTILSVIRRVALYQGRVRPTLQLHGKGPVPAMPPPLLDGAAATRIARGRWGLLGLPLFHFGIAVVVAGGWWSSWAGYAAHLELSEGEVFSGKQNKLVVERASSAPPEFTALLRLDRVLVEVVDGKYLRELQAYFSLQREDNSLEQAVVQSNQPLDLGDYRIFPDNTMGYSVLFERFRPDGHKTHLYINFPILRSEWGTPPPLTHRALVELGGYPLFYQMTLQVGDPPVLDLKVREGDKVIFDGIVQPGSVADLEAYRLVFKEVVPWLGFYLASDRPMYLVFAGFILALGGFLLHLVIGFRRVELVITADGWEVRAWVMRNDWRFRQQWDCWQRQISVVGDPSV